MKIPVYLDYSSTTPMDRRVVKKMLSYMTINGIFGNSTSNYHAFGWKAAEAVDIARIEIAKLINADFREIIFTSGATESNNLAIKGIASCFKKNKHIITSKTEHKSVLNCCLYLENEGFEVTYLIPKKNGIIEIDTIKNAIKENTILVSIMHVNNETGVIQNIKKIGNLCKRYNILYHVDASQSIGKIPINLKNININLMSFSGHKIYGPKGIGILYIDYKIKKRLTPLFHGGGHEYNLRSGTLPVHQIVGIGEACRILKKEMNKNIKYLLYLRNLFWKRISDIENVFINGEKKFLVPSILNISFVGIKNISFILKIKEIAVSLGSTCHFTKLKSSYVLHAMGLQKRFINSAIRFSFGKFITKQEIYFVTDIIKKKLKINNL